jgi:hypothetical protein
VGLNYIKGTGGLAFANLACSLRELHVQHTASVLPDAAGFLAALSQLTALTSLCAGSNAMKDLPPQWSELQALKVGGVGGGACLSSQQSRH